jgi:hypothetical protein
VRFCLTRGLNAPSGEVRLARGMDAPSGGARLAQGPVPPRVRFRLTRGLDAPSGEVRPARGSRGHATLVPAPRPSHLMLSHLQVHAVPLTRLGAIFRRCSANPPGKAIPATVRYCAVRPVSAPRHCATHSRTAGAPRPRKRTAEPSKGDGRPFRARTGPCRDVGRAPSVTISLVRPSPPPRRHPRHCSAIPDAMEAHDDKTPPRRLLCTLRLPVSCTLESVYRRRLNGRFQHRHPRSRSWADTGHTATSRSKQDSPGRPSTPRHCTPRHHT